MSAPSPEIDASLVRRAQAGDQDALRSVVERAYPLVRRQALVHTGDPTDADDLTQDVLIQMIRKLDAFHGESRFTTWLYVITRNAAVDRHRNRHRRARLADEPAAYEALVPSEAEDPSRHAERAELRALLRAFFEELPERQREVFDLVELQGLPAREAAERMGLEPVSVRAHLFKARKRLRARILAEHPELGAEAS